MFHGAEHAINRHTSSSDSLVAHDDVVGLDVAVDDVDALQVLCDAEELDGEVEDERGAERLTQQLVQVHQIL